MPAAASRRRLGIRGRCPQEIAQTRGKLPFAYRPGGSSGGRLFDSKEEGGRYEDTRKNPSKRLVVRAPRR